LTPHDGIPNATQASVDASLSFTISSPGNHTIGVTYQGDTNYTSSVSPTLDVTAKYNAAYFTLSINPGTILFGNSVTLTATLGTNSKTLAPSGKLSYGDPSIVPTNTVITDNNGNLALQSVVTYTPPFEQTVQAQYFNDSNYWDISSNSESITMSDSTFSISPIPDIVISPPGASNAAWVTFNSVKGFVGQVSVTCSMPVAMKEAACDPAGLHLYGSGSSSIPVNIRTTAPHQVGTAPRITAHIFSIGILGAMFLLATPGRRRRKSFVFFVVLVLMMSVMSCGGGGNGGGGSGGGPQTDAGTPKGTYTVTMNANSGSITQTATVNVTVQ
jgi:hypothetical protein